MPTSCPTFNFSPNEIWTPDEANRGWGWKDGKRILSRGTFTADHKPYDRRNPAIVNMKILAYPPKPKNPMTVAIKNNNKIPLVVPTSVRRRAGFKSGQEIEFKASGGVITILPKLPKADDEYTPTQRRVIDAQLDAAEKSPFHGPFKTADEMIAYLKGALKKRAAVKKPNRAR